MCRLLITVAIICHSSTSSFYLRLRESCVEGTGALWFICGYVGMASLLVAIGRIRLICNNLQLSSWKRKSKGVCLSCYLRTHWNLTRCFFNFRPSFCLFVFLFVCLCLPAYVSLSVGLCICLFPCVSCVRVCKDFFSISLCLFLLAVYVFLSFFLSRTLKLSLSFSFPFSLSLSVSLFLPLSLSLCSFSVPDSIFVFVSPSASISVCISFFLVSIFLPENKRIPDRYPFLFRYWFYGRITTNLIRRNS